MDLLDGYDKGKVLFIKCNYLSFILSYKFFEVMSYEL